MKEIAKGNHPFLCSEKSKEEAVKYFKRKRGKSTKIELIENISG